MTTPSEQFKARGLSGRYVIMLAYPDGTPVSGRSTHGLGCTVLNESWEVGADSYLAGTDFAPVPVEEVPATSEPCRKCGGGAYRLWMAQQQGSA